MRIIIFGASSNNINRCAKVLNLDQVEIEAFVDNNEKLWGTFVEKGNHIKEKYPDLGYYWPIDHIPVIGSREIKDHAYDYVLISSLYYADQIYEQLLSLQVDKQKILLAVDSELFLPIYFEIDKFGYGKEVRQLFKDNFYENLWTYVESIKRTCNIPDHILRLKDILLPLEAFTGSRNIFYSEFRDILQLYFFGEEILEFNEGPYEIEGLELEKEDIVIDCGANIGMFSSYAALKADKGTVYAFEPFPEAYDILNVTASYYDNIKVMKTALADKKETAQLSLMGELGNSTLLNSGSGDAAGGFIEVEVDTIDSFVRENKITKVDFIKADIEGAERNMLMGAKNTIKRFAPKISVCTYHLPDDKEVLEQIIKDINPSYTVVHRWRKLYAFVPDRGTGMQSLN